MMMEKILVSACLLGNPVCYNGSVKSVEHPSLERWRREERLVALCPELTAGFSVPRPPAEISNGQNGQAVLTGNDQVFEATGADVTGLYIGGAQPWLPVCPSGRWKPLLRERLHL